jgi:hypothetical protein
MDGYAIETLARLPLALAVFELFSYVLDERGLGELFEQHRGRCYERELTFAAVVYLLRDALLTHEGSGLASFDAAKEAGALPVAVKNAYEKLGRLPLGLSMALLRHATERLSGLMPLLPGRPDPLSASLSAFEVVAFDGKKIKRAAKRLKALRGLPGKMLGGKLLAAMHVRQGLALAIEADPDGERNDVPLVPGLVRQVREMLGDGDGDDGDNDGRRPILWMGDRQFGSNLDLPALLSEGGDQFLLRCTTTLKFHPDEARAAQEGVDERGRRWVQRWGWVGSAKDKRRRYVRQITLYRPGETGGDVILVTGLLDERAYPAEDLLAAYLLRWGIECMFQQVTEVFDLRKLIGSTPQAMVFQSAFCFVLYNLIQVIRSYVADGAGREAQEVSAEKLFDGTRRQLSAWAELGEPMHATEYVPPASTPAVLDERLRGLLGGGRVWRQRWLKSKPKKPQPPRPKARVAKGQGGHASVWRVMQAYKQQGERP